MNPELSGSAGQLVLAYLVCLLSFRNICMLPHLPGIYVDSGDLNSVPHACVTRALAFDLFLHPQRYV